MNISAELDFSIMPLHVSAMGHMGIGSAIFASFVSLAHYVQVMVASEKVVTDRNHVVERARRCKEHHDERE
jgi:hypothetical protein